MSWFLTCFAAGAEYEREMDHMIESFRMYHPDIPVITGRFPQDGRPWQRISNFKTKWLLRTRWQWPDLGSVLWVDADARFRRKIEPPKGAHVAAKRYGRQPSRVSTGTLWIGEGWQGTAFLNVWHEATRFTDISNEVTAEAVLDDLPNVGYSELPDGFTSPCSLKKRWNGKLLHDSAIVHWNMSRSVVEGQENWPPDEDTRRRAQP